MWIMLVHVYSRVMHISNFRVHNIQQGNQVQIGSITAGDLTLTSAPMYHDGTSTVNREFVLWMYLA